MSELSITIPHHLTVDEAMRRSKTLLKDKFDGVLISDLNEKWSGNIDEFSFSTNGFSVTGTLTVKSTEIQISGNLPWTARFIKGRIEEFIRKRVENTLR